MGDDCKLPNEFSLFFYRPDNVNLKLVWPFPGGD